VISVTDHKRYHLVPVRMVFIKKKRNNNRWLGCGGKGYLAHRWWECGLGQPLCNTVLTVLKESENRMTMWLSHTSATVYPKEVRPPLCKTTCTLNAQCSSIYNSHGYGNKKTSANRWLDKEIAVSVCNGILFSP
jgi:hypothetical protein